MKFGKIINFTNMFGQCDYKNLDIDTIIAGSQGYKKGGAYFVFACEGELPSHDDISELTQSQWQDEKNAIDLEKRGGQGSPTPEERIAQLELQQGSLLMEIALLKAGGVV